MVIVGLPLRRELLLGVICWDHDADEELIRTFDKRFLSEYKGLVGAAGNLLQISVELSIRGAAKPNMTRRCRRGGS
jgi:hypothetical protein